MIQVIILGDSIMLLKVSMIGAVNMLGNYYFPDLHIVKNWMKEKSLNGLISQEMSWDVVNAYLIYIYHFLPDIPAVLDQTKTLVHQSYIEGMDAAGLMQFLGQETCACKT